MATIKATFYECEHNGDLDRYKDDIVKCGGKIISAVINDEEEEGTIVFEVPDKPSFIEKFKLTDSWQFVY